MNKFETKWNELYESQRNMQLKRDLRNGKNKIESQKEETKITNTCRT